MAELGPGGPPGSLRHTMFVVIFGHETPAGRRFDVALIAAILISVTVVMLETVQPLRARYGDTFYAVEWGFTLLFSVEYILRIWCVDRPRRYILSPLGLIDLLAVLPTYVSVLIPGGQALAVVRILRVMRVFRILRLTRYMGAATVLADALRASRYRISVFLLGVSSIVVVVGSLMYLIEGPDTGFTSIPRAVYWAVVTLTTVGYGDIAPQSPAGQTLAALLMVLGYAIIAVPTGIVTAEITAARIPPRDADRPCPSCGAVGHERDARFCRICASPL